MGGAHVSGWTLFGTDLALMFVVMSFASVFSFRTKDPSYIDALWGAGFVVVAVAAAVQTDGDTGRKALIVGLTAVWGTRLATYLLWRWRKNGPDPRYPKLYGANPSNTKIWLRIFGFQALLLTVISLPVQLGQLSDGRLTVLNWIGALLAVTGIVVETVADAQLTAFRRDAANHGKVMDRGLWGWSRHPNYFGESLTWWGIGLVAWHDPLTTLGLLGPAVITYFLLTKSGIGPLERQLTKTKPQYVDYIARTSAFLPRPPRKEVPA
jgi:steroid 5-alpha reductase family enzyme